MKRAERTIKRAVFGVARRLIRSRPQVLGEDGAAPLVAPAPSPAGGRPPAAGFADLAAARLQRILVMRQDRRLGNLVLVTSLLQGLRRACPAARLEIAAPAGFAAVLEHATCVDRVIPVAHRRLLRQPWRLRPLAAALRAPQVADLVIDASPVHHFSLSSGLGCLASGAPRRLGYLRGAAPTFLNRLLPPPAARLHEHEILHGLVRGLGWPAIPAPLPAVAVSADERRLAARAFERWGIAGRPVVGLHPGGRRAKRWPESCFEAAAHRIEADGAAVLVFAAAAERPLLERMAPPGPTRVYAPPTSVRGLMALASACTVFLSGDCGPMHLAAALGVPCVSVFLVDDAWRYGPSGPGHRVLGGHPDGVEPRAVVAAVGELLAAAAVPLD